MKNQNISTSTSKDTVLCAKAHLRHVRLACEIVLEILIYKAFYFMYLMHILLDQFLKDSLQYTKSNGL